MCAIPESVTPSCMARAAYPQPQGLPRNTPSPLPFGDAISSFAVQDMLVHHVGRSQHGPVMVDQQLELVCQCSPAIAFSIFVDIYGLFKDKRRLISLPFDSLRCMVGD